MPIPPFVHDLIFFFNNIQKQSVNVVNRLMYLQFINRVGSPLDFRQLMTNDEAWATIGSVIFRIYVC